MQIERTITVTHRYKITASSEEGFKNAECVARMPSVCKASMEKVTSEGQRFVYSLELVDQEEEILKKGATEPFDTNKASDAAWDFQSLYGHKPTSQEDWLTKGSKALAEAVSKKKEKEEAAERVEPFDGILLSAGNDVLRSRIIMKRVQDALDEQWLIVWGNVPVRFNDLAVEEGDAHPRHATRSEVGHISAMFPDTVFFRHRK